MRPRGTESAHSRPVDHPGKRNVVDVKRRASYFLPAFFAGHRLTDGGLICFCSHQERFVNRSVTFA